MVDTQSLYGGAMQVSRFHSPAPWRDTGSQVKSGCTSVRQAMIDAKLDFKVEVVEAHQQLPDGSYKVADDHKFIRRTDNNTILGRCGKVWEPLQNVDAFDFFQPFVDQKLARIDTVGSLDKGQKIWITAELNRRPAVITPKDEVAKFILLMNGHDGGTSIRGGFCPFRLWCYNMMAMLRSSLKAGTSQMIRIRHSGNVKRNVDDLRDIMNAADASFEATAEVYRHLASRQFNEKDLERFVKVVVKADPNKRLEDLATRTQNNINRIRHLVHHGKGNRLDGTRGTWYAALNGVQEYFTHERGRNENNRLRSMFVGTGVADNERALNEAIKAADQKDGYSGRAAAVAMFN